MKGRMIKKCDQCDKMNSENSKYCSECGYELPKLKISEEVTLEKPTTEKPKKKHLFLQILLGIIAFGVSYFGVKTLFDTSISFDKAMIKVADKINENCPFMIDSETRLDNAVVLPNNTFQYNYTLINIAKEDFNITPFKEYLEPTIINNIKTNPDMKNFRDNETTLVYYYKDKSGVFLTKIIVTPDMYK